MTPLAKVHHCLSNFLPQFEHAAHIYVGYSGGLDSHVLLHSLADFFGESRVTAIHVNHQMSPNASQWMDHCRNICRDLGVGCVCEDVVVPMVASRENAAREARYQVFEQCLEGGDILTLAHHADDQAETVLYRLLRRSGPRGLAGMPVSRKLGAGTLLRPLLNLNRETLLQYAQAKGLQWVEDGSNLSCQFDRNFLRHEVVPQLKFRWPDYAKRIAAAATLCEQAEELNEDLARIDLEHMALRDERRGCSVEIQPLAALSYGRKTNVLRYLARLKGFMPPGHRTLDEVINSLLLAQQDRNPLVVWPDGEWRRFRQRLFLMSANTTEANIDDAAPDYGQSWSVTKSLSLADGATLTAIPVVGGGLGIKASNRLTVSFRHGGERCRPADRAGSTSLKKLFQEYGLEPWLRSRVPLLYCDGELAAIGDLCVCEGFQASEGEQGYRLLWRY
ncbi:MAG: tRNA lysidine(34) synthetase TilS [Gammaproteobacteria bacterium]|nr:MAG: tRNA lysidine(34) synthetase TilS [Gammaproteobacteria bacterium]RLA54644.1 MAG: tRNA lysidine(34) synthetase TilS [Gammaproteobacteria bacterium]